MIAQIATDILTEASTSNHSPFIIGVSGFGGSGKSTLAKKLAETLTDTEIVSIDSFITPAIFERSNDWKGFDRDRLVTEVLQPARSAQEISFGEYNWEQQQITHTTTLTPSRFLIIEGCSIFHPDLQRLIDYRIWIDASLEEATKRGISRDLAAGQDNESLWREVWEPNERDFFEAFRPDLRADILYIPETSID